MPKKFESGDIFGVPLPDGSLALGQFLSRERQALNSVGCALFSATCPTTGPVPGELTPISALLLTPDLLNKGIWPLLTKREAIVPPE